MVKIDKYLAVSGASSPVRAKFDRVVDGIPNLSGNAYDMACQVYDALREQGFDYDAKTFRAQDVLKNKRANCLGMPLLLASVLDAKGVDSGVNVVVNPHDVFYPALENSFLKRIETETRYDNPILASTEAQTRDYRFCPLEHLVLDFNGRTFETTSGDHELRGYESKQEVGFDNALSFVLKDRATLAFQEGKFDESIKLANEGLKIWPENRELHGLLCSIYGGLGQTDNVDKHRREYAKIGGSDSHFCFQRYKQTGDVAFLDEALKLNPSFAMALGWKAKETEKGNPQEAKFLYSLASQLYASSYVLDLPDFYLTHKDSLGRLFGADKVKGIMGGFVSRVRA